MPAPTFLQIGRTGGEDRSAEVQPDQNKAAIGKLADAHGNVHALLDQMHIAI